MKKIVLGLLVVLSLTGCATNKTAKAKTKESTTETSQSSTIESISTVESTSKEVIKYRTVSYKTLDPNALVAVATDEAYEKNLQVDEYLRSIYWGEQYDVYYGGKFDVDGEVTMINLKLEADIFSQTIVNAASGSEASYTLWTGFVEKFTNISSELGEISFAVYFPGYDDKFLFQAIDGNVIEDVVEKAREAGFSKDDY